MPLLMILLLVRLPTWIILVPVSACWRWWGGGLFFVPVGRGGDGGFVRVPGGGAPTWGGPREVVWARPALLPLVVVVLLVRWPAWIIVVPVSACWRWWVSATEWNSPVESSPSSTQLGYFQVIAEPVSTWVQVTLLRSPRHSARLVTKL